MQTMFGMSQTQTASTHSHVFATFKHQFATNLTDLWKSQKHACGLRGANHPLCVYFLFSSYQQDIVVNKNPGNGSSSSEYRTTARWHNTHSMHTVILVKCCLTDIKQQSAQIRPVVSNWDTGPKKTGEKNWNIVWSRKDPHPPTHTHNIPPSSISHQLLSLLLFLSSFTFPSHSPPPPPSLSLFPSPLQFICLSLSIICICLYYFFPHLPSSFSPSFTGSLPPPPPFPLLYLSLSAIHPPSLPASW